MTAVDDESENRPSSPDHELSVLLSEYAGRVIDLAFSLPDHAAGRHIRDELLRSGTAPGAHYAEARCAESQGDFTHKLALAAKEARESLYWLRVVDSSNEFEIDVHKTAELADRLVGWLYSSLQTAREGVDR